MSDFNFGALEDDAALEALEALENEALAQAAFEPEGFEPQPLEPDLSDLPILGFDEPAAPEASPQAAETPPRAPVSAAPGCD